MQLTRRHFILGTTAAAVGLGLYSLKPKTPAKVKAGPALKPRTLAKKIRYNDYSDIWREKWKWDKVVKGTHTRANCGDACSWDVYVKDGIAWREEQNAIYEPHRPDVPDMNPRGCQKGACYTTLQLSEARVKYPLKRAGERGEGKWKRLSWDQAVNEIADKLIDAAVAQGTESIIFDDGTTNAGYGPETVGDVFFAKGLECTLMDSWAGVSDMPMGLVQTWGMFNCEGSADDWYLSDYIVIWCGNPVYTKIPEVHFMHEARYRGAKLVVIAPDLSPSTVHADMWVNLKGETDAAFGLAAAQVMISENLFKKDYVLEQTDFPFLVRKDDKRFLRASDVVKGGADNALYMWDEAKKAIVIAPGCEGDGDGGHTLKLNGIKPALSGTFKVKLVDGSEVEVQTVFDKIREKLDKEFTPEQAAKVTGLHPNIIRTFAREMAAAKSSMIYASWGACRLYHCDLFQRAMALLMDLTGNQGKQGGGVKVMGWWWLEGLATMSEITLTTMEKIKLIPKAIRGLSPRDYEDIYKEVSDKEGWVPLIPFLYVHGGYKEMWDKPHLQDPTLPRQLSAYVRESLDKGWIPMHPPENRTPKAYIFTGCNPLRRWPSPQIAKKHLWPKLDVIVSINFRMSTSSLFADYILPAAAYYEKHGIKYAISYVPYVILSDKATEPLGEAKSEWVISAMLSKAIADRAKARKIPPVRGWNDKPNDLTTLYDRHTQNGRFDPLNDPDDPIRLLDLIFSNSPSVAAKSGREALDMGAVPVLSSPTGIVNQNYADYDPKDTYWAHRDMIEKKSAWPTLTGRQQFYIDHPWFIEGGESLPTHKDPVHSTSKYPLRLNGGHNRWSIHAQTRDLKMLLRMQRGQPACWMNPKDTEKRGIKDGDMVKIFNDHGTFECMVKVSALPGPGQVILYHAWEPYQFKNWMGPQEPVEAPWKALHMAGGYAQIHYRMYYAAPGHLPHGAPIEVVKA